MDNNVYLLRCRQHRRAGARRRRRRAGPDPRRWSATDGLRRVVTTHQHWDHHRALPRSSTATGAETVAGRRGRRRAAGARSTRRVARRRHGRGRRLPARGDPRSSATPRARSRCCTTTPTARRTCSPATRCSPAASARPRSPERLRVADRRRVDARSSTGCPTRPGSTPATATTRRSAPSARTSRSGARAAGEPVPGTDRDHISRYSGRRWHRPALYRFRYG